MLPRDKLQLLGVEALTHAELLAVVFGTGYKGVGVLEYARTLFRDYGEEGVLRVRTFQEVRNAGVPPVKASQLVAVMELGRRAFGKLPDKELHTPSDVASHTRWMVDLPKEQTRMILLDARNRILHEETVALGAVNLHILQPKDFFRIALQYNALNTIIVHNHPSGDPTPSDADVAFTQMIVIGGTQIGIPLLDHVVIGKEGHVSIRTEEASLFSDQDACLST